MSKRPEHKRNSPKRPIAFQDGMAAAEELPLPHVHYPGFYGTFFAFSEAANSLLILCACSMVAVENYIQTRLASPRNDSTDPMRNYVLDSMNFPLSLVHRLMSKRAETRGEIFSYLRFEERLCHECNRATPAYRYCHEMYGTVFVQNYGWYINKQRLEYSVYSSRLGSACPQEILDLIEINPQDYWARLQGLLDGDPIAAKELEARYLQQSSKVNRAIENEVRRKFGHKKIGEAWTSETILYYQIVKLFPGYDVLHHYRPDFLDGLELDIYVPALKLGIEYQGIQHYEPIDHWGGQAALERTQERDKKKREHCRIEGVRLVYFSYDEDLSLELVRSRVQA
jgi:hypothetical protein